MNARRTATTALLGVAAAGTLLASASAATAEARHDPGMARMHELMTEQNPGMARMHRLMTNGPR